LVRRPHRKRNRRTYPSLSLGSRVAGDEYVISHASEDKDGIVTRSISGEQILLPIWHNITKQQVVDFSPSLADKVARSTATHTVEEIAEEIAEVIG
jgi:hypothetical protein